MKRSGFFLLFLHAIVCSQMGPIHKSLLQLIIEVPILSLIDIHSGSFLNKYERFDKGLPYIQVHVYKLNLRILIRRTE